VDVFSQEIQVFNGRKIKREKCVFENQVKMLACELNIFAVVFALNNIRDNILVYCRLA
jgi:hypothetical protein